MSKTCTDRTGRTWLVTWGIVDPVQVLKDEFSVDASLMQGTDESAVFTDPLYPDETKTLSIYVAPNGQTVALSEITPGVYAAGILQAG